MTIAEAGDGASIGMPPGVHVGGLGARFVAFLIDRSVPLLISGVAGIVSVQLPDARTPVLVVALVLILAWGLLVWQMFAVRAAGPGMRLMRLQLVGYTDGRPIGWGRFLLRWLVLSLLAATGVGLLLMIIFLLLQPRKQGWHDLVADSVVIKERVLAPSRPPVVANTDPAVRPRTAEVPAAPAPPPTPYAETPTSAPEVLAPPPGSGTVETEQAEQAEQQTQLSPALAMAAHDPRPLHQDWQVVLDDGREIDVTGLVLLGRNPQPRPGEEDAQLIKVADEGRTVSKSHLALGVDGNGMYVMDRNSTNGSTVTTEDGQSRRCPPGDIVPVQPGIVVSFGDHWLEVRRPTR